MNATENPTPEAVVAKLMGADATPLRSLKAARALGSRIGHEVSLDLDGLHVSAALRKATTAAGSTQRHADEASSEAFYVVRTRQADAHSAGTWCPEGPDGCAFCRGEIPASPFGHGGV